jgi:hypothetical protein
MSRAVKFVKIPATVLATAESIDELEDWFLANDKEALEELRALRKEHLAGKTRSLDEAEKKWRAK